MANHAEPWSAWARMYKQPRIAADELVVRTLPKDPGVYAWHHGGAPVYVGKASGNGGLRERLGRHLGTGLDLSRSSLRRNVAETLMGVPTALSKQRPSVMAAADVHAVNEWIRSCLVSWILLPSGAEAVNFERELLRERKLAFSRR